MSECEQIRERLYSLATGECEPETAKKIQEHIAKCRQCAAEFSRLREVLRLTGMLAGTEPTRDLYPAVASGMRPRHYWFKIGAAAAAAAVFVILMLYAVMGPVKPSESEPAPIQADNKQVRPEEEQLVENMPDTLPEIPEREKLPEELPERKPVVVKTPQDQPQEAPDGPEDVEKPRLVEKPESPRDVPERPAPEPERPAALASIGALAGEVKVKRTGGEEEVQAGVLFNILPGDTVVTNSLGRARIDFPDGDKLYLNNNARLEIAAQEKELVFKLDKGEVYLEKESEEKTMAVDTGFGRVRARRGRFNLKMSGKNKCLLHIFEGEVECRDTDKGYHGKYGESTRAWFQRGRHCQKGTKLRSKEAIRWTLKLRPDDPEKKQAKQDRPDGPKKPGHPGGPPGVGPKMPPPPDGKKPHPPGDGKKGPGMPPPPPPGKGGPHGPGNGQHQGGGTKGTGK